jgi:hypothetical protein
VTGSGNDTIDGGGGGDPSLLVLATTPSPTGQDRPSTVARGGIRWFCGQPRRSILATSTRPQAT